MPNWIKGSLKLRGKKEDIRRFFNEGVEDSAVCDKEHENSVIDKSDGGMLWFEFYNEPYIKTTRRAFIESECAEMYGDYGVCVVDIKQAWGFDAGDNGLQNWKDIAQKYNLDIRLYGIESGMEFCQEIIITKETFEYKEIKYDNWDWDCPFPRMGG